MAAGVIARLRNSIRRRNAIRRAIVDLYGEGMCRHVHAQVWQVSQLSGDPVHEIRYVHDCGDNCAWLRARRTAEEHLGAW
jgi:hypothetical protein